MATNSLKFYKGKYADFKSLTNKNADSLYFTLPDDTKDPNDVLSSSHGIWLGDNLLSSSYVANDKGNLTNVELTDKDGDGVQGQFLKYTYILSNGETKIVYTNVGELLVESEFTSGLEVSNNGEVSVKVASNTPSNKNFLTVDDNGLAVKSINTDSTILEKDIMVAGHGSSGFGQYPDKYNISAGTSVYEILKKILCNETYPTLSYQNGTGTTTSISGLSISLSSTTASYTNESFIKFGTEVSAITKSGVNNINSIKNMVSGFTYGYRDTITGSIINSESITAATTAYTNTIEESGNTNYKINVSYFDGTSEENTDTSQTACTITKKLTLDHVLGENIISASGYCPDIIINTDTIESRYNVSNVSGSSEDEKSTKINAEQLIKQGASGVTTFKVYAVLPFFVNWDTSGNVNNTYREILPNEKDKNYEFTVSESDTYKYFNIQVPKTLGYSSTYIWNTLNTNTDKYESYSNQILSEEITKNIDGTDYDYISLTDKSAQSGNNKYKLNFSKNLHTYK